MARLKGIVRIDRQDIVGKCLGKFEVVSYNSMKYDSTRGGMKMRHWYNCIRDGQMVVVQRGQILAGIGGKSNVNKNAQ